MGVGDEASDELDSEVGGTVVAGVLDLRDVLELVGNREEPIAAGSIWSWPPWVLMA
jgi:hypothetical protein